MFSRKVDFLNILTRKPDLRYVRKKVQLLSMCLETQIHFQFLSKMWTLFCWEVEQTFLIKSESEPDNDEMIESEDDIEMW